MPHATLRVDRLVRRPPTDGLSVLDLLERRIVERQTPSRSRRLSDRRVRRHQRQRRRKSHQKASLSYHVRVPFITVQIEPSIPSTVITRPVSAVP